MVLDFNSVHAGFPDTIEGFFFMAGAGIGDRQTAQRAHAAFLQEYGVSASAAPPLMKLSLASDDQPFTMAPLL